MRNSVTLFLCFLIFPLSISGQKSSSETRTIQFRHKDNTIECTMLLQGQEAIKAKRNKLYHWYNFDQIYVNEGAFSGLLLHGIYRVFDSSGRLVEQGRFDSGQKNGIWTKWDSGGFVINEVQWKNGCKTGALRTYEDGNLLKIEHFKDGVLHGKVMRFDSDGTCVTQRFRKGVLVEKDVDESRIHVLFKSLFEMVFKSKKASSTTSEENSAELKE